MVEVVGFSGKIGTGKNYVCEELFLKCPLLPPKRTIVLAFADQLKVDAVVQGNFSYEEVYYTKPEIVRTYMQTHGTERRSISEDVWIRYMDTWVKVHAERGMERFLITDVRFRNEADWVKRMGGKLFRIEAPQRNALRRNGIADHISECDLDTYGNFDFCLMNDPGDESAVAAHVERIVVDSFQVEQINSPQ